jgi:hypothetical protein
VGFAPRVVILETRRGLSAEAAVRTLAPEPPERPMLPGWGRYGTPRPLCSDSRHSEGIAKIGGTKLGRNR